MKMTDKLYYIDSHLREFRATVTGCVNENGIFEVTLDRTAFFPEGGGQLGDSGYIGESRVVDTQERDGEIIHYCEKELHVGDSVDCRLDWDIRFRRMQNHSGEHILSGIIHEIFGYDNVGFHMGEENITVDYDGYITPDMLREIEQRANAVVFSNVEIKTEFPSDEELKNMHYRSKLELTENVRIVTVEGVDICACCAPHVKRTGEIGVIKLLDSIHYKGGVRIHLLCGYDALEDYHERYESTKKIAAELSVKQKEVAEATLRKLCEFAEYREKHAELRRELTEMKINAIKPSDGNIVIFDDGADPDTARRIANAGADLCSGICAVFSNGNYCMVSRHADLRAKAREINAAICGRGGGSSEMIRGVAAASRAEIEKYFGEK